MYCAMRFFCLTLLAVPTGTPCFEKLLNPSSLGPQFLDPTHPHPKPWSLNSDFLTYRLGQIVSSIESGGLKLKKFRGDLGVMRG